MLEAILLLGFMRITPEKVKDLLVVLRMISAKLNLKRSLNLLDSLDILDSWANTSMAAQNSLLFISNNSCEWHLFKCFVDLCEYTIWIINVFSKSLCTFISET
jgi:hypothetical protein